MLTILGFTIPQKILATTDLAKKFSRQAKALEQIARFHNTIGDRMITSQVTRFGCCYLNLDYEINLVKF